MQDDKPKYESTPIDCEFCKKNTFVKPNGDCPTCGRLLTVFPGFHMDPALYEARVMALRQEAR